MYYGFKLTKLPVIRSVYSVTRNTVWQITDKSHIFIIVTDGRCEITCNGETHIVNKGELFFVPANYSYIRKSVNSELCEMTYIHFDAASEITEYSSQELCEILADSKNMSRQSLINGDMQHFDTVFLKGLITPDNIGEFSAHINDLHKYMQKKSVMSGLDMSIALCSILSLLTKCVIAEMHMDLSIKEAYNVPQKLKRAISYIMQNYASPLTLDELARYCNISKQHLIRYFKSELGTTPLKYITEYRVTRAKELLFNYPDLSIGEISEELGFENQHYFSKVFSKITGETPSDYRYRTIYYHKLKKEDDGDEKL